MQPAIHHVELREGEVVQVGVHLLPWPGQIQEVEQRVQENDQKGNISIGQSAYQQVYKSVKAVSPTAVISTTEIPSELFEDGTSIFTLR